jgi:glycerophosphoryl diester phosphodiesterase
MKIYLICFLITFPLFAKIEIQGHRGARSVRPENTLAAFKYALEIGVDVLELDTVVTKDNILIVSHDPLVNTEICKIPADSKIKPGMPFYNLSLAEVKTLDCGTLINPKFPAQVPSPGEKIPTLEEVLELVKGNDNIRLNIETKIMAAAPELTPSPREFSSLIIELLKLHKLEKRAVIQSFDYRTLIESKKLFPSMKTAFLAYGSYFDFTILLESFPFDIYSPNYQWITKEMVDKFHMKGVEVIPWTANDKAAWEYLLQIGADGIITDDPKALMDFLRAKNLLPSKVVEVSPKVETKAQEVKAEIVEPKLLEPVSEAKDEPKPVTEASLEPAPVEKVEAKN